MAARKGADAVGGDDETPLFDVIIVGGGPAGLSAALVLGRCRRRVLICDAGQPRNAASHAMHGFLSRDGISPAEFLQISREQLRPYETVEHRSTKVEDIRRGERSFTAVTSAGVEVSSRTVLLATGLVDELPEVEGFRQFYGVTAHNCPYCDGWEHRDQPLAVLGGKQDAADLAIELLLWSKDVLLCPNGPAEYSRETLRTLDRNGIRVVEKPIRKLEGTGSKLEAIVFCDGSRSSRSAVFFSPGQRQRSHLAEKLGCSFCEEDGCIKAEKFGETCVPGIYAAGNASQGVQLVISAASEGMHAAFAINNALLEADAKRGEIASRSAASA